VGYRAFPLDFCVFVSVPFANLSTPPAATDCIVASIQLIEQPDQFDPVYHAYESCMEFIVFVLEVHTMIWATALALESFLFPEASLFAEGPLQEIHKRVSIRARVHLSISSGFLMTYV